MHFDVMVHYVKWIYVCQKVFKQPICDKSFDDCSEYDLWGLAIYLSQFIVTTQSFHTRQKYM